MAAWAREDEHHTAHSIYPLGFQDHMVEGVRDTLWALMAAVALVLMIAASNVANLMLARGESRTREISIRVALGAGRARIARQLLTESLVLAGAGGTLGVGLAWLGLKGMLAINPSALPRMNEIGVSLPVLAFTGVVSVGTALIFGLVPALLAGRKAVSSSLSDTRTTGGKSRKRFRQVLIAAEVALSLVVVLSAGLVVRSFRTLVNVDSGMSTESVLTFGVSLPFTDYESVESVLNFYDQFLDRVNALSGVDRASFVHLLPIPEGGRHTDILIEGRSVPGQGEAKWNAAHYMVQSGYLETTRIPLKSGRAFSASDGPGSELVALVSEEAARVFWPGDNPVGKRFGYEENDRNSPSLVTVVGVVGDVKVAGLDVETRPQIYVLQNQTERLWGFTARTGNVLVRAGVKPESLVPAVRSVLANLDPSLPLANVRTMSDVIRSSVARPRLAANLLASFALVALVLAAVGVYGVVSYSVARRTREIGIRLALGANSVRVVRMMVHEGVGPALLGIVVGLTVAFGATVVLEGMLFGVSRTDPFTFIAIPATLLIVAIVASWIPSTRATRVDPTKALRTE